MVIIYLAQLTNFDIDNNFANRAYLRLAILQREGLICHYKMAIDTLLGKLLPVNPEKGVRKKQ